MRAAIFREGARYAPSLLRKLDQISKATTLHSICFENDGVGLTFWEEVRVPVELLQIMARLESQQEPFNSEVLRGLVHRNTISVRNQVTKAGLVVYGYFSSLDEAVDSEWRRLKLDEEAPDVAH